MSTRAYLLGRAAECQHLTSKEGGEVKRMALSLLRDMWVALARESERMEPDALAREIAAIERIQSDLNPAARTTH